MPQTNNQHLVARQVERIVRQLTSLSTLPAVAAEMLATVSNQTADPTLLAEHIQSDPALTAKVLTLAYQEGVQFTNGPTIAEAVAKLPVTVLREAVISVKVFGLVNGSADEKDGSTFRKLMAQHSLAVGCCAGQIAEHVLEPSQRQTAYLAGLLHDIGKCALDEVMPKSFAKMVNQARMTQSNLAEIEQTHLGLDHTVLGKRLGQKWSLPEAITSAIWLHHCDAQALSAELPDVQITRIVALADRLVRKVELGHSGSFDIPDGIDELAKQLGIGPEQLNLICDSLGSTISQKCKLLGMEAPDETSRYYSMIHQAATDLAQDNRKLSVNSQEQERLCVQAQLIDDFLNDVDEHTSALDVAECLAGCWQKHCQSGLTCVYVVPDSTEPYVEMAATDRQGKATVQTLQMPDGIPPVPEAFRRHNCILPIADGAKWLTEQLAADFDPRLLKMAPLRMGDEVVGVLIFEALNWTETDDTAAPLSCKVAASVIALAQSGHKRDLLAERFVQVMSTLRQTRAELARQQSLAGLAEMAAGAAHEFNNPLAVISGRAQLLMSAEPDEDKKQMLAQINERSEELTQIVSDLLAFARPAGPEKRSFSISELLQNAISKTSSESEIDRMEIEITGQSKNDSVYVDVHQITQSISSILANALQSYKGENGPVWVDCFPSPIANAVCVVIRDNGCGMDKEALANACQPFYSSCQAGRRRGMGLAHAQRLLNLNGGTLKLDSKPDEGTTATLTLPKV